MIKVTFCLKRKPGLSLVEFQDYWLNKHGPLVRSFQDVLQIKRYVQVHRQDVAMNAAMAASRHAPEAFDGVAELWFDSYAAIEANAASKEARAANRTLLEDEKKFIDLENSPIWLSEENVVVGKPMTFE